MPYVVTCTFRKPAKSYFLDPRDLELHVNNQIIGHTERGLEIGLVKFLPRDVTDDKIIPPLRVVERVANAEDLKTDAENRQHEDDAMATIRDRIAAHGLPMKPIRCELLFDRSKLYFYYESEERVDFRELLRDLVPRIGYRLHLQQVSPREAAANLGGVGVCGRELCCSTWLTTLPPITLKMAKEQGMSLTPSKISGSCGRLMCCLRYEVEFYRDQNQKLPRPGTPVDSPEGPGHVIAVNVLSEECIVELGDGRRISVDGDTLRSIRTERGPVRACSNHINQGGSCEGAAGGGCSSGGGCGSKKGGCGSGGGCGSKKGGCGGCGSKKKAAVAEPEPALA
jgi:cell fate regulator YaaT (PSP1 superfamily)